MWKRPGGSELAPLWPGSNTNTVYSAQWAQPATQCKLIIFHVISWEENWMIECKWSGLQSRNEDVVSRSSTQCFTRKEAFRMLPWRQWHFLESRLTMPRLLSYNTTSWHTPHYISCMYAPFVTTLQVYPEEHNQYHHSQQHRRRHHHYHQYLHYHYHLLLIKVNQILDPPN